MCLGFDREGHIQLLLFVQVINGDTWHTNSILKIQFCCFSNLGCEYIILQHTALQIFSLITGSQLQIAVAGQYFKHRFSALTAGRSFSSCYCVSGLSRSRCCGTMMDLRHPRYAGTSTHGNTYTNRHLAPDHSLEDSLAFDVVL